jgi:hypothetical protein
MFKKSLLALAVVGFAGVANAGTIASSYDGAELATTPTSSSIEAAQSTTVTADAVLQAGIGGYQVGDTITFQMTGAKIDLATSLSPTLAVSGGAVGVDDITILDITETQVRFTVNDGSVAGGGVLELTGINLDATDLGASSEVSYNAFATNTSGTMFDVSSGAVVADLIKQYSAVVTTKLDGVIDVTADRQSLALNGTDAFSGQLINEDTLVITVTQDAGGTIVNPVNGTYTITAAEGFSWLDEAADASDDDTAATPAELKTYFDNAGSALVSGDAFEGASLNESLDTLTIQQA